MGESGEDDGNVITLGELRVRRVRRLGAARDQACRHLHLEMDDHGETVQCVDCRVYVTPYWALRHLLDRLQEGFSRLHDERQQAAWERKKLIRRVAARKIEAAWNGGMVPTCPHCDAGILPEDGFGGDQVSKELEMQRRGKVSG
jgi:hypothetical protein